MTGKIDRVIFKRKTFYTQTEEFAHVNGQTFEIEGMKFDRFAPEDEPALMFEIRTEDGTQVTAFPEEVFDEEEAIRAYGGEQEATCT